MTTKTTNPKERLLQTARELTYRYGMTVGVNELLQQAGVARKSLYDYFGSKDELIATVLRTTAADDEAQRVRVMDAAGNDPRARLLAIFDELIKTTQAPGFRGCRYAAAELAITDPKHPALAVIRAYKQDFYSALLSEVQKLHLPHGATLASQLLLLIDGVLVAAAAQPQTQPAQAARNLAARLISATSSV